MLRQISVPAFLAEEDGAIGLALALAAAGEVMFHTSEQIRKNAQWILAKTVPPDALTRGNMTQVLNDEWVLLGAWIN